MRPGPIRVGHDFGTRYHVQKLLGSGGMGVVYQALDHELGVEIALKVLRAPAPGPKVALSMIEMQRRLRTELVLARQITHKNVIRIHDIGDVNGIRFISMALVKGPDLAGVLKGGRLPSARAVRYARQLAAGLLALDAPGVVHRDIKPGNIMIADGDQAVLMDFGIAKAGGASRSAHTKTGGVIGTPAYMAPEQARGEAVDPRTDIYAFGLVLYEMLTGPRTDMSPAELAVRMKSAPQVRAANPRVSPALAAIVTKCLQPAREDRYQTSVELGAALAALGRRASREGRSPSNRSGSMRRVAAVVLTAALAGGGYWLTTVVDGKVLAPVLARERTPAPPARRESPRTRAFAMAPADALLRPEARLEFRFWEWGDRRDALAACYAQAL